MITVPFDTLKLARNLKIFGFSTHFRLVITLIISISFVKPTFATSLEVNEYTVFSTAQALAGPEICKINVDKEKLRFVRRKIGEIWGIEAPHKIRGQVDLQKLLYNNWSKSEKEDYCEDVKATWDSLSIE